MNAPNPDQPEEGSGLIVLAVAIALGPPLEGQEVVVVAAALAGE